MTRTVAVALASAALFAACATSAAAAVPPSLTTLESSAEDLVDAALAGNRAEVTAVAASLSRVARGPVANSLKRAHLRRATIRRLEARATAVDRIAARGSFTRVALAANAVSGLMPGVYRHFRDRVPPSVLTLDYLDRETQLRALAGERKRVTAAVRRLASTWRPLRRRVIAAGGAKPAAAYTTHVAAMTRLLKRTLKEVRAEAVHGLVLVDRLEAVFTR
jgi:hypothetical protein